MNEQLPSLGPEDNEPGKHLEGLLHELNRLVTILSGNLTSLEDRSTALSALAISQACLDSLPQLMHSPPTTPGYYGQVVSGDFKEETRVTHRQLARIAHRVRAGRAEMTHHAERRSHDSGPPPPSVPPDESLVEAELALLHLLIPAARPDRLDIYIWGVIGWYFRIQRPQHLARVLAARGHRVFYISNEFIDRPYPGFTIEPLDQQGRLYQVHLYLTARPQIYVDAPTPAQITQLDAGLAKFTAWNASNESISILQHSYWAKLAEYAPPSRIVYDCLDHQAGFSDNSTSILAEERRLLEEADLVIVTSQWLHQELSSTNPNIAIIRNGCDYERFSTMPADVFVDPDGRKVIGYYGAIEQWLDIALLRAVAERFTEHLLLLIGRDMAGAQSALSDLGNVRFIGEVRYEQLPYWLYGIDVCLLPFKVLPLTLATNPVKIYEYLSAGKPVVAVDLPEMSQFGDLIRTAATHEAFMDAVADALDTAEDISQPVKRQAFAAQQTWDHRVDHLEEVLAQVRLPRVSVIVVAVGGVMFTRKCLDSVERYSGWPEMEVIVVDNGLQDGTEEFLESWQRDAGLRHVITDTADSGFAAACNLGLAAATGEYLILLNNHTYVTRGWIRGLLGHLRRDPGIGLVGPVTNNVDNEARIDIDYADMEEMAERSRLFTVTRTGRCLDLSTVAFFCVAMARGTYKKVGPLSEDVEIRFIEDEDYCRRIRQTGLRCVCAEDVFIHQHPFCHGGRGGDIMEKG